ncbi:MAG: hypothetical protein Q8N21_03780 [bacterium]|nr:hypothetical protein [bacterium]
MANEENQNQNNSGDNDDLALQAPDENELEQDSAKQEEKNGEEKGEENVIIAKSKMALIKKLLNNIKENNDRLTQLLSGYLSAEEETSIGIGQITDENFGASEQEQDGSKVIEGVFDGENMIGPDGKQYSVPANYASKSKLVEGDILKLTITANGTFIFKQIGPIERSRVIATVERAGEGNFIAAAGGKKWRLLTASITYYRGEPGDEVVILTPKAGESQWAAVENVVKKPFV